MRDLFATSAEGLRLTALYYTYAPETGRQGLDDPALMWDAWIALQSFVPGFEALVDGRGDQVMITQGMVDLVKDVVTRLANAGSPELAAAINAELTRYHDLQDFAGQSFAQAASRLGLLANKSYLPVVRR